MSDPRHDKSLARSLGEFLGHIWRGVRSNPGKPGARELRRSVEETARETPEGRVTLRRTTIDEIELHPPENG